MSESFQVVKKNGYYCNKCVGMPLNHCCKLVCESIKFITKAEAV